MEIRIGVQNVAREIVLESEQSKEEIENLVVNANDEFLRVLDKSGREVLVPRHALGYVEIGAPESRRAGFGVGAR